MMYLGIIKETFKDAGMRDDLILKLSIIIWISDRALPGKIYNRAVCNKLFYEALHGLLIGRFYESVSKCHRKSNIHV